MSESQIIILPEDIQIQQPAVVADVARPDEASAAQAPVGQAEQQARDWVFARQDENAREDSQSSAQAAVLLLYYQGRAKADEKIKAKQRQKGKEEENEEAEKA